MKDFFEIGNMANSQDKELTKEGEFEEISIVVATKLSPHSWVLYYMKYNARLQTKAQRIFNFTARNSWLVWVWWCISLLVTQVDQVGHICYTRVYIFSIIYLLGTIYFEFIHNWGDVINRNTCYFVYFHQNRSQHSFCRILKEKKIQTSTYLGDDVKNYKKNEYIQSCRIITIKKVNCMIIFFFYPIFH